MPLDMSLEWRDGYTMLFFISVILVVVRQHRALLGRALDHRVDGLCCLSSDLPRAYLLR